MLRDTDHEGCTNDNVTATARHNAARRMGDVRMVEQAIMPGARRSGCESNGAGFGASCSSTER